jgi:hypothetical protein
MGFVEAHKDSWSAGGMGTFVLTGTALVAKNPEKFGVTLIDTKDADIVRTVGFQTHAAGERHVLSAEEGDDSFDDTRGIFPAARGRPWAGSIDALHSMIYYDEHGRTAFKDHARRTSPTPSSPADGDSGDGFDILEAPIAVNGRLAESDFAIDGIFVARGRLRGNVLHLQESAIEPTYQQFQTWQRGQTPMDRDETVSYWIVQDGRCLRIADSVYRLLLAASGTSRPVGALLEDFAPASRQRLSEHLRSLERLGCIRRRTAEVVSVLARISA